MAITTPDQVRKAALSLADTSERDRDGGGVEFVVAGASFVSLDEQEVVRLRLTVVEADDLLAAHPTATRLDGSSTEVMVPIADVNGQQLNHWVRRAWHAQAPEELAVRADAAEVAVPGEVGDLPKSIGRPATRALVGAGVESLADVASWARADLQALHGVGPKAIRILGEWLEERGLSFRT